MSPETLCADGVGPCHRDFGGPGLYRGCSDVSCDDEPPEKPGPFVGARYLSAGSVSSTRSATRLRERSRTSSSTRCSRVTKASTSMPRRGSCPADLPEDLCPTDEDDCCKYRDDLIEILNTGTEPVDLSGLWLSSSPFGPEAWQFPPGVHHPGGSPGTSPYIRVWLDNDGGKCPDPNRSRDDRPCFWECPDPTNPGMSEYHANFSLAAEGDQIYLFDSGLLGGRIRGHPRRRVRPAGVEPVPAVSSRTEPARAPGSRRRPPSSCESVRPEPLPSRRRRRQLRCRHHRCGLRPQLPLLRWRCAALPRRRRPERLGHHGHHGRNLHPELPLPRHRGPERAGPGCLGIDPTPDDLVTCTSSTC